MPKLDKEYVESLVGSGDQNLEFLKEDISKAKDKMIGRPGKGITKDEIGKYKDMMVGKPGVNEELFEKAKKNAYASGGKVSSASKRADGCAQRGKTKGRMV